MPHRTKQTEYSPRMQPTHRDCVELCGEGHTKANTLLLEFLPSSDRQDLYTVPLVSGHYSSQLWPCNPVLICSCSLVWAAGFSCSVEIYQEQSTEPYFWLNLCVPNFQIFLNITQQIATGARVSFQQLIFSQSVSKLLGSHKTRKFITVKCWVTEVKPQA